MPAPPSAGSPNKTTDAVVHAVNQFCPDYGIEIIRTKVRNVTKLLQKIGTLLVLCHLRPYASVNHVSI